MSRRFDEQPPGVPRAGLGDRPEPALLTGGGLAGDQSDVAAELPGAREALKVADLCTQADGGQGVDPAQAPQPSDLHRPRAGRQQRDDLALQAVAAMAERVDRAAGVQHRRVRRRPVQRDRRKPLAVTLGPRLPVIEPDPVTQQQLRQAMASSHQIHPDRVAGADQVAQRPSSSPGTLTACSLPANNNRTRCSASRRSVFTRSPLARGILLGAATTHSTPRLASSRARSYPVGPASYATRTGRAKPAQNPAAPSASPLIENVCSCPVSASRTAATIFVACTSKPTRLLAFAMAGSSNMRLWAVARRLPRGMNFTPRTPWGSRPLLHRGPDGRSIHIVYPFVP